MNDNLSYSPADIFMTSLCLWREARSEGLQGMAAVAWVIRNRAEKRKTSPMVEVTRKWQFSSITDPNDHQITLWPAESDSYWKTAQMVAQSVLEDSNGISDPTNGATMYYSDIIPFPASWNKEALTFTVKIGHHNFYTEI